MKRWIAMLAALWPGLSLAQDGVLHVSAPPALIDSGLLAHILPRFALKHGLRAVVDRNLAEARFGDTGQPVFQGLGQLWHLAQDDTPEADRLLSWLRSDVGKRTVEGFRPDGEAIFTVDLAPAAPVVVTLSEGDAAAGEALSVLHCGRCHAVNAATRMTSIGSTPSFGALRNRADWDRLFTTFYILNPHPSFTQIENVTRPFDSARPSPIHPVFMTQSDLEAILAYVEQMTPADLGAPVQSQ